MADPEGTSSGESVMSNDDLSIQILVRLPFLSLVLFKSVSKRWNSLIKEANLTIRHKHDPPSGLFLPKYSYQNNPQGSYTCDFVPLDNRIPATNFTFGPEVHHKSDDDVRISDSCNGLLLCRTNSGKVYVCNPSITNMFKLLPQPHNVTFNLNTIFGGLIMAFDPTKSPHYKLIYARITDLYLDDGLFQMHTYSSKSGNWSICGHRFSNLCFLSFRNGVYCNDAIYWIDNGKNYIFKLDIKNEDPVLTDIRIPKTVYRNVRYECGLFESRGCLLVVGKGEDHSRHMTIYEKGNEYSEWSLKYTVNLDDIINPSPKRLSEYPHVFCIVLGEREEDSFIVTGLNQKIIQYKIVSKTLSTISALGPKYCHFKCVQFIPSFANV